ncbi:MAG: hypothetical protein ABI183_14150 [Polyangiaceae bacterium]
MTACASAPVHKPVAEEAIPVDTSSPTPQPPDPDAGDESSDSPPTAVDPPDSADTKNDPPADAVASKLDARNGFGAATFGVAPKSLKGLKVVEKKPDRAIYKVGGKNQYAGVTLKEVQLTFLKGKLAKISFTPAVADCKTVHDAFERDYGSAQKHVTMPIAADVWRGADVGLRYNNSGTVCSGVMIRRDLATTEWTGLDQ